MAITKDDLQHLSLVFGGQTFVQLRNVDLANNGQDLVSGGQVFAVTLPYNDAAVAARPQLFFVL